MTKPPKDTTPAPAEESPPERHVPTLGRPRVETLEPFAMRMCTRIIAELDQEVSRLNHEVHRRSRTISRSDLIRFYLERGLAMDNPNSRYVLKEREERDALDRERCSLEAKLRAAKEDLLTASKENLSLRKEVENLRGTSTPGPHAQKAGRNAITSVEQLRLLLQGLGQRIREFSEELDSLSTSSPPEFLPDAPQPPGPGVYRWLVVICREGVSEVTGFWEREDAEAFFETASAQWSDSFLAQVVRGPIT